MQKITPFLWFNDNAEQAMNFYVSVFKNSKVLSVTLSVAPLLRVMPCTPSPPLSQPVAWRSTAGRSQRASVAAAS